MELATKQQLDRINTASASKGYIKRRGLLSLQQQMQDCISTCECEGENSSNTEIGCSWTYGDQLAYIVDKLYFKLFPKTKPYEVGVEVKENPSKSEKLTWVEYKVEAASEQEARRKASDLCGEEFGHNPWTTEII